MPLKCFQTKVISQSVLLSDVGWGYLISRNVQGEEGQ